MSTGLAEFRKKFMLDVLSVYENEYWVWSLHPKQYTLGSGVLSLKRLCTRLSDISEQEALGMAASIRVIEHACSKLFSYDKINYLMLMMIDSHLHYHIIPRYSDSRIFADEEWHDNGWASLPVLESKELSDEILIHIRDCLRQSL